MMSRETAELVEELTRHMRIMPNPRCQCRECRSAAIIVRLSDQVDGLQMMLANVGDSRGAEIDRLRKLAEWQQSYIGELTDKLRNGEVDG